MERRVTSVLQQRTAHQHNEMDTRASHLRDSARAGYQPWRSLETARLESAAAWWAGSAHDDAV